MGKAEVGTPKYIANKMKAKGLQKLRWYCQMCQKQCRDENGFKCHTMSESHQRQLLLFADNAKKYMDEFSFEFAKGYLQILKRQFGTKRVAANRVYQEYITDKNHLHMNATRWVTLTGFVKWLGKTGKCVVDETEKGWFITYIDRDPETIEKQERRNKRIKMEKTDEEQTRLLIERQIKHHLETAGPSKESVYTELVRENEDEKVTLDIKLEAPKPKIVPNILPLDKLVKQKQEENKSVKGDEDEDDNEQNKLKRKQEDVKSFKKPKIEKSKKSALDEIMEAEEKKREKSNRKEYWICEGVVVKVMTKALGQDYYKAKGVIVEVKDRFTAIVKMLDNGKKIKVDQEHLETVLPAIGRLVKVVNGAYRGNTAILLYIDEKNFCADIEIASGLLKGRNVKNVEYEDICKIHSDL